MWIGVNVPNFGLVEERNTSITEADITAHPELKVARWAVLPQAARPPSVRHEGPALFDEARIPVDGYYRRSPYSALCVDSVTAPH